MNAYDFVHLVRLAFDGRIQGRTKLQKTVYFVGALTGLLPRLGFRPWFYGPYSSEVMRAVNELRGLGFLEQRVASGGQVDSKGFEVARYDYLLTEEGKQIAQEKAEQFATDWPKIRGAAERLKSLHSGDYVKLSIAAKMYFLLGERHSGATGAELSRMTPSFGWTVSEEEMNEAGEFLHSLGLLRREGAS